jgi:hypothetical protein
MYAVVKYQIATYSGEVIVRLNDVDEENELLIAKAKKKLGIPFPICYEYFKVVERNSDESED